MEKFRKSIDRRFPGRGFNRLMEIGKSDERYEDKIRLIQTEYGVSYATAVKYLRNAKHYVQA